jgi:transcriptional regulator with XRE-family HTH domain
LRGIKQEFLASELGVSQQSISRIEQSETVEEDKLQQIAQVLGVTAEAIKNFSEEAVFNNFHDNSSGDFRQHCTFNPIDKIVELYDEKVALLERLLQVSGKRLSC